MSNNRKILMMEGNPLSVQTRAASLGVRTASQVYTDAVRMFDNELELDILNVADGEILPSGKEFDDYAGLIITGSSLRAFEQTPEVLNQINFLIQFARSGKPVLGSCWGLQIAAMAAGGKVGPSPNGRELGIARKIVKTVSGQHHPFLKGKSDVFDAPCIHYDEVIELPNCATLLASNKHSYVQAAIIPVEKSEVWAVQYHPEFDLCDLSMLFKLYGKDMLQQGFVQNEQEHVSLLSAYECLQSNRNNKAIAWQLGIDQDILDNSIRAAEIANWLKHALV